MRQHKTRRRAEWAPLSPKLIRSKLEKYKIQITDLLARQILDYIDLLGRWNQKINLTSVRDPLLAVDRHFGESLFGAISMGIESGDLLDIGSGSGFPALPIAMLCPKVKETLLEPNGKKAAFLSEVCRRLRLYNRVKVVRCRFEEFSSPAKFAFITSRAVRVTAGFLEHCAQILRPGGRIILWLGFEESEIAANIPGWTWNPPIRIPGSEQRYVICGTPKAK